MKKLLLGGVAALSIAISAPSAQAADLVNTPFGYDWSGFYLGGQLGYGFGDHTWRESNIPAPAETPSFDVDGFVVGGTIGYNMNVGTNFVLGLEGDFSASDISGSTAGGNGFGCDGGICRNDIDWFASARVRAGHSMGASNDLLIYVTGGVAFGDVSGADGAQLAAGATSGDDVLVGWTAGAGVERVFSESITGKLEYLYTDLGTLDLPRNCGTDCVTDIDFHLIRAGINLHF
jgi:outer membrane immunogenic protein